MSQYNIFKVPRIADIVFVCNHNMHWALNAAPNALYNDF